MVHQGAGLTHEQGLMNRPGVSGDSGAMLCSWRWPSGSSYIECATTETADGVDDSEGAAALLLTFRAEPEESFEERPELGKHSLFLLPVAAVGGEA